MSTHPAASLALCFGSVSASPGLRRAAAADPRETPSNTGAQGNDQLILQLNPGGQTFTDIRKVHGQVFE